MPDYTSNIIHPNTTKSSHKEHGININSKQNPLQSLFNLTQSFYFYTRPHLTTIVTTTTTTNAPYSGSTSKSRGLLPKGKIWTRPDVLPSRAQAQTRGAGVPIGHSESPGGYSQQRRRFVTCHVSLLTYHLLSAIKIFIYLNYVIVSIFYL